MFILGADSLHTLPHWHCARRVLGLAEIAVAGRAGEELERDVAALRAFEPDARVHGLDAHVPPLSSTELRALLARGADVSGMLDPRVLDYIRSYGLYRFR